jgi:hypothetical protein
MQQNQKKTRCNLKIQISQRARVDVFRGLAIAHSWKNHHHSKG